MAPTPYKFSQYGKSGTWVSELLPWTGKIVDDIAVIKSLHTDILNHDSAVTFILTGNAMSGRASIGAWVSYGLGQINENLPTFVVLPGGENYRISAIGQYKAAVWTLEIPAGEGSALITA